MRNTFGVHSFELVAGLVFVVPILLYSIDYATILYGGAMNDNLCSAAARAASSGPPSMYTGSGSTPKARAAAVLANASQPGAIVRVKQTVRRQEIVNPPPPVPPFGGPVLGTVTIKTRCDVFPPFLLPFVPADVVLYTSQTYPWSWINPGTIGFGGSRDDTNTVSLQSNDITQPIPDTAP